MKLTVLLVDSTVTLHPSRVCALQYLQDNYANEDVDFDGVINFVENRDFRVLISDHDLGEVG